MGVLAKTAVVLTGLALWPAVAAADEVAIGGSNGLESLGSFSGSLGYDSGTGILTVSLSNDSPAANGGYITAFALNLPDTVSLTSVTLTPSSGTFALIGDPSFSNGIDAQPFGSFDLGAASTSSLQGGGDPTGGIGEGDSESFEFELTGSGLAGLSAAEILETLSSDPQGGGAEAFIVRFRGFEDGGSDMVPGSEVPEPTTLLLLGVGAAGLAWRTRASRRRTA